MIQIVDVVIGFLIICAGVILLQLAKSSKDVPDAAVFKGDLDQVRTVAEQEEPEYEPRADTIRGGAGIVRAMSRVRTMRQVDEAKKLREEAMEPIGEGEEVEWDGLRRRRTMSSARTGSVQRSKTVHPPLGMSYFPTEGAEEEVYPGFFGRLSKKRRTAFGSAQVERQGTHPVPLESVQVSPRKEDSDRSYAYESVPSLRKVEEHDQEDTSYPGGGHITFAGDVHDRREGSSHGSSTLAPPQPPPHASVGGGAKRQFSFQNVFHRNRKPSDNADDARPLSSRSALSFISGRSASGGQSSSSNPRDHSYPGTSGDGATEEERAGLVHGESSNFVPKYSEEGGIVEEPDSDERERGSSEDWQVTSGSLGSSPQDLGSASGGDISMGRQRRRDPYDDHDFDDDDDMRDVSITPIEYQGARRW